MSRLPGARSAHRARAGEPHRRGAATRRLRRPAGAGRHHRPLPHLRAHRRARGQSRRHLADRRAARASCARIHESFVAATDPEDKAQWNHEFHKMINRAGGSRRLVSVLGPAVAQPAGALLRVRAQLGRRSPPATTPASSTALEARDAHEAQRIMEHHVAESGDLAVEILQEMGYWDRGRRTGGSERARRGVATWRRSTASGSWSSATSSPAPTRGWSWPTSAPTCSRSRTRPIPTTPRSMGPHFQGDQSLYFLALNSGKRSIGVRLASAEGRAVVEDLVRDADVVIDNYRPGVLAKFGLDHDALHRVESRGGHVLADGLRRDRPRRDRGPATTTRSRRSPGS